MVIKVGFTHNCCFGLMTLTPVSSLCRVQAGESLGSSAIPNALKQMQDIRSYLIRDSFSWSKMKI